MPYSFRWALVALALAGRAHGLDCGKAAVMITADQHDGDQKKLELVAGDFHHGLTLTITPHNNTQTWKVKTPWNELHCNASVDFRVPGKPNPPPVALTLTMFLGEGGEGQSPQHFAVFTDPSATLAPRYMPLNTWVEIPGASIAGRFHIDTSPSDASRPPTENSGYRNSDDAQ